MKKVHIDNFMDFRDRNDQWVRTFSKVIDGICYHYTTRAGKLYGAIIKRTTVSGCVSKQTSRYSASRNLFENFQFFAEWCQTQHGYLNKENTGKFWSLDKDILLIGNKDYSEEVCCFVPIRVNCLLISNVGSRGEYPVGVHLDQRGKYVAQINGSGRGKYLGRFNSAQEAHRAWQIAKISNILDAAKDLELGVNVRESLIKRAFQIKEDVDKRRETVLV